MMRFLLSLSLCACSLTTTKVIQIDKKSTLEQQFIGEYEELSDDLATIASVRADASGLGKSGNDPYARALQARRVQHFYKDDLDHARAQGCIGEATTGRVQAVPCSQASSQPAVERLVAQENQARDALVDYTLSKISQPKDAERQLVWQALRRIVLETLPKGTPVQNNAGGWVPK
jgi:uncharacterized protein YdbL (DUF1318 family)